MLAISVYTRHVASAGHGECIIGHSDTRGSPRDMDWLYCSLIQERLCVEIPEYHAAKMTKKTFWQYVNCKESCKIHGVRIFPRLLWHYTKNIPINTYHLGSFNCRERRPPHPTNLALRLRICKCAEDLYTLRGIKSIRTRPWKKCKHSEISYVTYAVTTSWYYCTIYR